MAIYLDTAIVAEAARASKFGWIAGITTNPTLLAKSELSPEETLKKLAQLIPGEVYYQLMASDFDGMVAEGKAAFESIGRQTVLKVPATVAGFQAVAHLSPSIKKRGDSYLQRGPGRCFSIRGGQICEILRSARHQIVGRRFCFSPRYGRCLEKNKY
jgi:hypothetical protein